MACLARAEDTERWKILGFFSLGALLTFALVALHAPGVSACPLVLKMGPKQKAQAQLAGYCRINGGRKNASTEGISAVRKRAYVTNSDGDSIAIIDRDSYRVVHVLSVGDYPHHMILSLDGRYLYVGNTHSNTVSAIDLITETTEKTLPLLDPYNFYYTPDRKFLVTTCTRLGRVEVHKAEEWEKMDSAKGWKRLARIPTGKHPNHFAFSPDGRAMYVSNEYSHELSVIDLEGRRVLRQLKTGSRPVDVSLAPGGKFLFVAVYGEGRVNVYDTESWEEVGRIRTGAGAHGMAMSIDGRTLFVSNRDAFSVSAIDIESRTVTKTMKVPQGPDMMEVSPDGRELWVTGRYGSNVYVVNLASGKVKKTVRTGASPHGIVLIDLLIPAQAVSSSPQKRDPLPPRSLY